MITACDRLDKLADDFVEHCSTRWETGKSMLVCIDKITCARMFQRIEPRWRLKLGQVQALILRARRHWRRPPIQMNGSVWSASLEKLRGQAQWMESTSSRSSLAKLRTRCATSRSGALTSSRTAW